MGKRSYRKKGSYKKRKGSRKGSRKYRKRKSRAKYAQYRSTTCKQYSKYNCSNDPGCHWVKKKGCSRRSGVLKPLNRGGLRYHGPIGKFPSGPVIKAWKPKPGMPKRRPPPPPVPGKISLLSRSPGSPAGYARIVQA